MNISSPFTIGVDIRPGDEKLSGCHPIRAGVGLRKGVSCASLSTHFFMEMDKTIKNFYNSIYNLKIIRLQSTELKFFIKLARRIWIPTGTAIYEAPKKVIFKITIRCLIAAPLI